MHARETASPRLDTRTDSDAYEQALEWLSARAIELVCFPPEQDLYDYICEKVKEAVGNAIVCVNSIDIESSVLRVRRLAGIGHTRLRRVEELLKRKVIGSTFQGVHEEATRQLNSGSLAEIEGGSYRMFFGRVPHAVCFALEKLLGVKSVHSIGLRRNDRLLGNVTILALSGARLNRHVVEAFVNQASAALDRQQAEGEARHANEMLNVIARNVTDLVWMAEFRGVRELSAETLAEERLDAERLLDRWRFTFVSPSSERVLGYAPDELKRLSLRGVFAEEAWFGVRERFAGELALALADPAYSQPPGPMEFQHLGGDGHPRWCEVTARFLRNGDSNIVGVLGVTRDVDERRRATEALREERDRFGQLLEIQERDRSLVACEIHDGLIQPIAAAVMYLETHLLLLQNETPAGAAVERAKSARELLSKGIAAARRLIQGLRPAALDEFGVIPALENLVADHQTDSGPAIEFVHDVRFDRLDPSLETAVFRVVQEALVNALRHARSDCIKVRLVQRDEHLTVEVSDRGIGFDPAHVRRTSFGLEGMRRRAQMFNGHAKVDSQPGRGTRITVVFPVVPQSAR